MAGRSAAALLGPKADVPVASGPATQKTGDQDPPGRGLCTEFGDYWIVPDDTVQCYDVEGEQITESDFAALEADWNTVKDNSGTIQITDTDSSGNAHAGFCASILAKIGMLMSQPSGRQLIRNLLQGGQQVTIRPSVGMIRGGATTSGQSMSVLENLDGTSGGGGGSIIEVDPNVSDTDIKVYDAAGNEISDPVFIFLGHELIHAQHNQAGHNKNRHSVALEEQQTISGGNGISENDLRAEHGLTARHGHAGRDVRP